MYLSPREKQLLAEFFGSLSPVTTQKMTSLLKVSKRIIHCKLDNLEVSLKSVNASLKKVARGSFVIEASEEVMEQLKENTEGKSDDLPTAKRQHAILAELLLTTEPLSLAHFMELYRINNTTFYTDIKQLGESIRQPPLEIIRSQEYKIVGPERYRRLLTANVLELEVNEYEPLHSIPFDSSPNYFFRSVDPQHLSPARQVVGEELIQKKTNLSDRKLEHLVLILTLTMDRVMKNHLLTNETYNGLANKELLQTAKQLFSRVASETKQLYLVNEIVFFAGLLNDFTNSFDQNFFEETFDTQLAYLVKQLIQEVSEETNVHFYRDETLYRMLLTHLSGVFSRAVLQKETLTNPILEKIMVQYEEITNAIRKIIEWIFREKKLPEEEIVCMVLHFTNSLERSPKEDDISIARFSPSGLASTSMLELRLKRYFPFIQQIHFYRVADLKKINLQEEYDIVISTSILPGYDGKYILVLPPLLEDEVKQLKEAFSYIEKKKRQENTYNSNNEWMLEDTHEETMHFMEQVNQLPDRFLIQELDNPNTVSETIRSSFSYLPEGLVTDEGVVHRQLFKRYEQTPIGIPHTNMGLFHTSSSLVSKPIFCIFDLRQPLATDGMDRWPVDLSRVLVTLAPSPIQEKDGILLGKISGAITMNDLDTEIFRPGNEEIVYQLLAKILIEEIRK